MASNSLRALATQSVYTGQFHFGGCQATIHHTFAITTPPILWPMKISGRVTSVAPCSWLLHVLGESHYSALTFLFPRRSSSSQLHILLIVALTFLLPVHAEA